MTPELYQMKFDRCVPLMVQLHYFM